MKWNPDKYFKDNKRPNEMFGVGFRGNTEWLFEIRNKPTVRATHYRIDRLGKERKSPEKTPTTFYRGSKLEE